jgi:hypothetical protein
MTRETTRQMLRQATRSAVTARVDGIRWRVVRHDRRMDGEPIEIQIGRPSEGVLIRVRGRERPESQDDDNWLDAAIEVRAGGFVRHLERVAVPADEFQRFRVQLERMYRDITGEAVLDSLEGWIQWTIRCEPNGAWSSLESCATHPATAANLPSRSATWTRATYPCSSDPWPSAKKHPQCGAITAHSEPKCRSRAHGDREFAYACRRLSGFSAAAAHMAPCAAGTFTT